MTKEEAVKKVVAFARAQIGYHETGDNLTKFAEESTMDEQAYGFSMDGQPWCDFFVDYCFWKSFGFHIGQRMLYQEGKSGGAACMNSAKFFVDNGAWHGAPEVGDQVIYAGQNHTGLVVATYGNGSFDAVDGNYSDSVKLRQGLWPSATSGFGRPNWSLVTGDDTEQEEETETEEESSTSTEELKAGDIVSIKRGAVFWDSTVALPALWYTSNWIVGSVRADGRVYLDQRENGDSGYRSAVSRIFLTKVSSSSETPHNSNLSEISTGSAGAENAQAATSYGVEGSMAAKIQQGTSPVIFNSKASATHTYGGRITNVQDRSK